MTQNTEITLNSYTISVVEKLTGIKPMTLRAWERRYSFLKPLRTDTGHRLYSFADVRKIKAIKKLLDNGFSVSRAANIVEKDESYLQEDEPIDNVWVTYITKIQQAVSEFNEQHLDDAYHEITSLYPIDLVTENLLVPLLNKLGEDWENREGSVAEEHFFSLYLRNKLGARFHHQNTQNQGRQLIVAGLPGDYHEFGLLLISLALMNHGFKVLILGPNLPTEELNYVLGKTKACAIVLSGSTEPDIQKLASEIVALTNQHNIPIFIGGSLANEHRSIFDSAGIYPVGTDLRTGIQQILNTLTPTKQGNSL